MSPTFCSFNTAIDPKLSTSFSAVLKSISWFTLAITPWNIKALITSTTGFFSLSAKSFTTIVSSISITSSGVSSTFSSFLLFPPFLILLFFLCCLLISSLIFDSYSSMISFFSAASFFCSSYSSFIRSASSSSMTLM